MTTPRYRYALGLCALLALAACGESGTELPFGDLTPEEQAELAVLTDPGSLEVALELTDATADAAAELGQPRALEGRALNAQARMLFADARAAMLAGDDRAALAAAHQARRLIAQALAEIGGDASLEALIERIEALALTAEDDVFDDADAVRAELERIAAEARALLARGETLAAAAHAILGEQIARHRRGRRDHPDIHVDRARLAVALARTSVRLAERLLADGTIPVVSDAAATDLADHRNRWLVQARHLLAHAEQALENGRLRRAVHFAQHAQWSALKAVILPGGIHEAELRAMVELAETLLAEAAAAVGDDPTELEARLLEWARSSLERGIHRLEEGYVRGIVAVWRCAVISAWLLT